VFDIRHIMSPAHKKRLLGCEISSRSLFFVYAVLRQPGCGGAGPHEGNAESMRTISVIPGLVYRDANAAIEWLKTVLGFTEHAVYRDGDGNVQHAELLYGNGMVMLGTAGLNKESAAWQVLPAELGGKVTGGVYLIVPDCTPVWEQVQAAHAEVLLSLRTMDYGGQAFTVRDPEGHVWSLGEYDPWALPKE
jgi:uncharacterized glyoxalase superfamily protein PhnB